MSRPADWLAQFESYIRRDPGRRGLLGAEDHFPPLLPGQLGAAAADLAATGRAAAIVTGFYIPAGTPPAAETDGPPGAIRLAETLTALDIRCQVITDGACASAVKAYARAAGFPVDLVIAPTPPDEFERWLADWKSGDFARNLTHLIAIERVGPSHTVASLTTQRRVGLPPTTRFEALVPPESRDCPHNMRGVDIGGHTAPLHRLFEEPILPGRIVRTIGIGDGGNEIGMGQVPWEELTARLSGDAAARVPCRVATHLTILAGVSNWGGSALAAAVAAMLGRVDVLESATCERERELLAAMVAAGPAVDGVTRAQEATVDGLPFLTYIQPWAGIRRLMGLAE